MLCAVENLTLQCDIDGLRCLFTPPGGEEQLDAYGRWVLETLYQHASVRSRRTAIPIPLYLYSRYSTSMLVPV
eukprot:COSAG06_NODE_37394_length_435_cov_1.717262_1_plen_72_part_10